MARIRGRSPRVAWSCVWSPCPQTTRPAAHPGATRLSRIRRARARASGASDHARRAHRRPILELAQRALDGALARAERGRERGGRPRFAAVEQREDRAGGPVDRRREHDDGAAVDGGEREAAGSRLDAGERAKRGAQAAELDAEARAVRFVGGAGLKARSTRRRAGRRRARPRRARRRARTGPGVCEGDERAGPRTTRRHASTTRSPEANSDSTSSRRTGRSTPRG